MLDSLIVAIVVAVAAWLVMRNGRTLRARQTTSRAAAAAPGMPRVGVPGTVTPAQLERLKALEFEPSPQWSREEADLILDAVAYLRTVIRQQSGEADPPVELQNRLLVLILTDAELRERLQAWGEARRARGKDAPLARDALFEGVAAAISAAPGDPVSPYSRARRRAPTS